MCTKILSFFKKAVFVGGTNDLDRFFKKNVLIFQNKSLFVMPPFCTPLFWWFNIRIRPTSFVLSFFFFNLGCNELKKMYYNFPNKTAICSKLAVKVELKEKVVYVLATLIKRCWSLKQRAILKKPYCSFTVEIFMFLFSLVIIKFIRDDVLFCVKP